MSSQQHDRDRATLIGSTAIFMWSTLALLTALSGNIPPFQLTAMSFTVAFAIAVVFWVKQKISIISALKLPFKVWILGIFGLFGYHFFYFLALQNAPVVEANLINYLWPLLIVLLSAFLPGEQLKWFHIVGAIAGFIGAGLLVTKGESFSFDPQYAIGYLAALICAFTWSCYSVLSRLFGAIPTYSVGGFCGATAILAWICHIFFEPTIFPARAEWLAILGLGLGPVGLAFFTWDYGVKQGNIKILAALSYSVPLFSTVLLIVFGLAEPSISVIFACLLIFCGAVLAAKDYFK
ncbi:MAG: EamA family transporter [Cyanobacteria bacterium SBLK]|nr:EamA family transporter [Cyanobacteria bacterium SBLK]